MRILVKRMGAFGDVLEATPIVARLKAENPDAEIHVLTHYTNVFMNDPCVSSVAPDSEDKYDRVIDLDGTFERLLRKVHPVDAYSEAAFGDRKTPHKIIYHSSPIRDDLRAILGEKNVVIHACRNWPIRTLPLKWWQNLVDLLTERGYTVIALGTLQDHDGLLRVIDTRSRLDTPTQAGLIEAANCFVCSESGPMILAQSTSTPVIAMLTMAAPFSPVHDCAGGLDVIMAKVPCAGCSEFFTEPTTYFDCKHGERSPDFRRCVTSFSVEEIADLVDRRQTDPRSR